MPSQTLVGVLCGLITTLACLQAARSFRKGYRFDAVFRCALLFGLLPLLYAPMIIAAVSVPVLLFLIRRRWRELVCAAIGLLLPVTIVSYIYWCRGYGIGYMLWYIWQEAVRIRLLRYDSGYSRYRIHSYPCCRRLPCRFYGLVL